MDKQHVSSSTVVSIGYDARTQTLEIEFGKRSCLPILWGPDRMHAEIMHAPSKGQFFNTYIRNAYAFSRVA